MIRRILIKGSSGARKSTLGRALARRLDVPYVELDALHHLPGWQAATASELMAAVTRELDDARGWIVDGNYDGKLGSLLLDRAELIAWLDLPLSTKLARLARRTARRWLRNEELWNGNRESLKGALGGPEALFPWAVRAHFRHRREWPELLRGRALVHLSAARDVEAWLSQFCESAPAAPER